MLEFPVEVTETGRQALRCAHRFAASGLDRPAGPSRMGFHVQCKSLRSSGQDSIRHCPMSHIQTFTHKDGKLVASTTGGTSMACVLEHVADTRPPSAIVVTDCYIEQLRP